MGLEEKDRIAKGLANTLITQLNEVKKFRFDSLNNAVMTVSCAVRKDFPASIQEARDEITHLRQRLASLKQGRDSLRKRKDLAEAIVFN